MGLALHCILEIDIAVNARMEGKSLAVAYCSDSMGDDTADAAGSTSNIVTVDFGGTKSSPTPHSADSETLLSPLDPFITEATSDQWHDASAGLAAVRSILQKIRNGAKASLAPDLGFGREDEDEDDLTADVCYDLEQLEKILLAAQECSIGFRLAFL